MGSKSSYLRKGLVRLVFVVSVTGFLLQSAYLYAHEGIVLTSREFWTNFPLDGENSSLTTRKPVTMASQQHPPLKALPKGPDVEKNRTGSSWKDRLAEVKQRHSRVTSQREIPPLKRNSDHFFKEPYKPLLYGTDKKETGFLTIGIPTVRRPNTERIYLIETVNSLIQNLNETDRNRITIVVLVADENATYNLDLAGLLYRRFQEHFDSGLMRVIQTNQAIYPNLNNVRKTFRDDKPRLKWRAKQNIDFAYMMLYSRTLSKYYMQIEDDLLTASNFLQDIENFVHDSTKHTPNWFLLEFSHLGFIGKLFRSSDLNFVASQLLDRYDERPCDLLLGPMRVTKGQPKPIHSSKSLFQHIGWFSSLKDKLMPSLDDKFKDTKKIRQYLFESSIIGDNPAGKVFTNMAPAFETSKPLYAYDGNLTTFFWAKTPRVKHEFVWIFETPHNFTRIVMNTGTVDTHKDFLTNGDFEYARPPRPGSRSDIKCNDFVKLATLFAGTVDTKASGIHIPDNIKCLRIIVRRRTKTWLVIRDLQVFTGE